MMYTPRRFETDLMHTSAGDLVFRFLGHGSLAFGFKCLQIYVDPFTGVADYMGMAKADVILVTHEHRDHLDLQAIADIRKEDTTIVLTETCARQIQGGIVMGNGDASTARGIPIEAVPAYNLVHKRENGQPFHPIGVGNGYILTFGDKRVYVAGDTENTPEMKRLQGIACAFLPMNIPYTMTPEMVADAACGFRPEVLYPYHFGDTDVSRLVLLMKKEEGIEVQVRRMA